MNQFRYTKIGHGKYQVLDNEGYDFIGSYVTLKDAKNTVAIENLKLQLRAMPLLPLLVANKLDAIELSVDKVEIVIYDMLFFADLQQLKEMVNNIDFLKECITANIYQ